MAAIWSFCMVVVLLRLPGAFASMARKRPAQQQMKSGTPEEPNPVPIGMQNQIPRARSQDLIPALTLPSGVCANRHLLTEYKGCQAFDLLNRRLEALDQLSFLARRGRAGQDTVDQFFVGQVF
jgi:hypothetical protein